LGQTLKIHSLATSPISRLITHPIAPIIVAVAPIPITSMRFSRALIPRYLSAQMISWADSLVSTMSEWVGILKVTAGLL
jgi:hypothetical protein